MKLPALILAAAVLMLGSCAYGPDWSPEVAAQAASYGNAPVYAPNGALLSAGSGSSTGRRTMFHD